MHYLETIRSFAQLQFAITSIKDIIEIIFFIVLIYSFVHLTERELNKTFSYFSYYFLSLFLLCIWFNLPSILSFLIFYMPALIIIYIVCRQDTLQRNSLRLIKPKKSSMPEFSWVDDLIKACLQVQTRKKTVMVIIEHSHSLVSFIKTSYMLNASISPELITLVCESLYYEHDKFLWINSQGTLKACNAHLESAIHPDWISEELVDNFQLAHLIALTKKTDALVLLSIPNHASFTLLAQGVLVDKIMSTTVVSIIKNYIKNTENPSTKKGIAWHEFIGKKQTFTHTPSA